MSLSELELDCIVQSMAVEIWTEYAISLHIHGDIGALPPIKTAFETSRYAGYAYKYQPMVFINLSYYTEISSHTDLRETIAHELAHVITWKLFPRASQNHGPEFRYVMGAIGYDEATYHRADVRAAKKVARAAKVDKFANMIDLS